MCVRFDRGRRRSADRLQRSECDETAPSGATMYGAPNTRSHMRAPLPPLPDARLLELGAMISCQASGGAAVIARRTLYGRWSVNAQRMTRCQVCTP